MKLLTNFYYKHRKILTFAGYFLACMVIFPAVTDIGWIWHFFGKEVMFVVDSGLSAWIAYGMAKESEL